MGGEGRVLSRRWPSAFHPPSPVGREATFPAPGQRLMVHGSNRADNLADNGFIPARL
jgi:hypothetical protein